MRDKSLARAQKIKKVKKKGVIVELYYGVKK